MTNREALAATISFLEIEVSDALIEKFLLEAKTEAANTYNEEQFAKVDLAEYKLLSLLSAKPEIKDGPFSRKFAVDTRLQHLTTSLDLGKKPTIIAYSW